MFWQIASFPRCQHHAFLSHCAADRGWLVHPVYDELQRRGIIPWLDRDDYYYGRDSRTALRDGLLHSRHVVFFVTLGVMDYRRGWCPMEAAYADVVQTNLNYLGGPLLNFSLPLFFLPRADPELPRTIWAAFQDRGVFHPGGDPVAWAVDQIDTFLHREQDVAANLTLATDPNTAAHTYLAGRPGLLARVTQFDPGPIP